MMSASFVYNVFFFNDTATTEIYTLSLHDALPICTAGKDPAKMPKLLQLHMSWADTQEQALQNALTEWPNGGMPFPKQDIRSDRKSTRLNSSHANISYAVFCLKKKKRTTFETSKIK